MEMSEQNRTPLSRFWLHTVGRSQCTIYAVEFETTMFSSRFFAQENITMPAHIKRSVPKRQCEYLHGRLAARQALLASGVGDTDIGSDERRAPLFPNSRVGSISHTDSLAVAAVMPAGEWNGLGIDIERRMGEQQLADAIAICLCSEEEQVLHTVALPLALAVTLTFSAKESFYKAVSRHCGRVLEFSVLRLQAIDTVHNKLHFSLTEPVCTDWPAHRRLSIDYGLIDGATVYTLFLW